MRDEPGSKGGVPTYHGHRDVASPVPKRDPRNGPQHPLSDRGHRPTGMTLQGGDTGDKQGDIPQPCQPSGPFPRQCSVPKQEGEAQQGRSCGCHRTTPRCQGLPGPLWPWDRGDQGGIGAGPARLQTSAARRDSRHVYLQQQNKEPIIYTKHTTMSVNKEAAGEGKAIYSNSANFSSSTIKKALIIFRNNRQLTNRFSRCK